MSDDDIRRRDDDWSAPGRFDRIDLRLPNRAELARAEVGSVPEFGFRVALTGKH